MCDLEKVKQKIMNASPDDVVFKSHFDLRTKSRPINRKMVLMYLCKPNNLFKVETQGSYSRAGMRIENGKKQYSSSL